MLNLTGKQSWWNLTTELRATDGTQIRCLLPPAARNWFLLQVSDGGWLARGDDIVFCNVTATDGNNIHYIHFWWQNINRGIQDIVLSTEL